MIYSPDHNFLLLKNQKVGGTSLEVDLSKNLPNNAIVTEINPKNKNHNPRNNKGFYNHMPYFEIEKKIDLSNVKSYVFVRNPYDIVLSNFFYQCKANNISSKEYTSYIDYYFYFNMIKSQKHIYTKNKKIVVDKILKYEKGIESEINLVLIEHKINTITLKTFEKAYRPKNFKPSNIFKKNHVEKIKKEWYWEFEMFDYDLEFVP